MTPTPRRPGLRLPWSSDAATQDQQADARADEGVSEAAAAEPSPEVEAVSPDVAETPRPGGEPAASEARPASAAPETGPDDDPFLRRLVDAMRGVADESRSRTLEELKATLAERSRQLASGAEEGAADLRRRSELDIKGIGDWATVETERIRAEAERKVEARRHQLEQQLAEHRDTTERQLSAMNERLTQHERALAEFFAHLSEIHDPAAFVAAAKRIPPAPSFDAADPSRGASQPEAANTLSSRLAELGIEKAPEPAVAEEPHDGAAQQQPALAATQAPTAGGDSTSTALMVKGLGSFGAITSFKQQLERTDGVTSVTLSLGPSGEFVYRASHAPGFDVEAAVSALENGATFERAEDGTLRVTLPRAR